MLKRFALIIAFCLLLPAQAWAVVAYDAFSQGSAEFTTTTSWTHTPVGTPRGVLCYGITNNDVDQISAVTYGGSSLAALAGSPHLVDLTEDGTVHAFFLGAAIPTGAQTVQVTASASAPKRAGCITLTAGGNTEIVDSDVIAVDGANPSVVLSAGGRSVFAAIGFFSGQNATSGITPLTSWTGRFEHATGAGNHTLAIYTYDTIGTTDVTAGWTATSASAGAIAALIAEVAAAGRSRANLTGVGK